MRHAIEQCASTTLVTGMCILGGRDGYTRDCSGSRSRGWALYEMLRCGHRLRAWSR